MGQGGEAEGEGYTKSKHLLSLAAHRGYIPLNVTLLEIFKPDSQHKPQLSGQNYKSCPDS